MIADCRLPIEETDDWEVSIDNRQSAMVNRQSAMEM
jgi:hypothetical protein